MSKLVWALAMKLSALILGALFVSATPAKADFLGLTPGDYTLTLAGSSSLCGGLNCTGTVHIGTPGETGFDWNFTIGTDVFSFDGPGVDTGVSPSGLHTIACESNTTVGFSCGIANNGAVNDLTNLLPTQFVLRRAINASWQYVGESTTLTGGSWTVTAISATVTEPFSGTLLLFGISALGLWRRLRVS